MGRKTQRAGDVPLRQRRALEALARWGLTARSMRCVSPGHAEVWRIIANPATGRASVELALRLYPAQPGLASALDDEVDLLRAAADSGLHVPGPLVTPDGRRRIVLDAGSHHAVLLHWLGGRQLWAGLRPVHLSRVGAFVARMHDVAAQRMHGACGTGRPAGGPDLETLSRGPDRLRAWGGHALRQAVMRAAACLRERVAAWPRDEAHWGWIHGDLHPWNLLFQRSQAGAIDFGDGGWGPLAQDLAAVLQFLRDPIGDGVDHRPQLPALRDALFEGYASVRRWPSDWPGQIDALHPVRLLNTLQWMLDDWSSPVERRWGPGFLQQLPRRLAACGEHAP